MPWSPAHRNATSQAAQILAKDGQQTTAQRKPETRKRLEEFFSFFLQFSWDFSHSFDQYPSLIHHLFLLSYRWWWHWFTILCLPISSISDLSNSKQVLLHSLSINSAEREQNVSLKCHMQLLYLVHFLNVCAYTQVNLGPMTSTILTSPKFNTNSLSLPHEGT